MRINVPSALSQLTGFEDLKRYVSAVISQLVNFAEVTPPTGTIFIYASETVPDGYLECNGAAISRKSFTSLFRVIGTAFGSGDGVDTFNTPDLRGRFIRGWDHGAGNDPDTATRSAIKTGGAQQDHVGSLESDQIGSHVHTVPFSAQNLAGGGLSINSVNGASTVNTGATGGNETRPKNVNLMYIIKV